MIRRSARYLLVVGIVAGATVAAHAPASHAAGSGCKDGAYCLWKNQNYKGDKVVVSTNDFFKFPKEFNNKASSFKNRAGIDVRLYAGKQGTGTNYCYPGGVSISSLGIASNIVSSSRTDPVGCG
jgi:hypothetical protein